MTCRPQRTDSTSDTTGAANLRGCIARLHLARAGTSPCSSDLDLERYLFMPERSSAAATAHVESCGSCQDRLADMRRVGAFFHREVYPATRWAVVSSGLARIGLVPRTPQGAELRGHAHLSRAGHQRNPQWMPNPRS